jgi:hypothetical protein
MTCSMSIRNFVETGRKLKKLKHVSALACIFVRRVHLFYLFDGWKLIVLATYNISSVVCHGYYVNM